MPSWKKDKDDNTDTTDRDELLVTESKEESTSPVIPDPVKKTRSKKQQTPISSLPSNKVKIINRGRTRNIELDFGRDKEIRIPSGESALMDKQYLTHPAFLEEKDNLTVIEI